MFVPLSVLWAFLVVIEGLEEPGKAPTNCTEDNSNEDDRMLMYRCTACHCGLHLGNRIVGGQIDYDNDNPWMVALILDRTKFICGGSLIADTYVLTAAHCVAASRPHQIQVLFSEHNHIEMDLDMSDRRDVTEIIIHPEYNYPVQFANDIALLRLSYPAPVGVTVNTVCLPVPNMELMEDFGRIAGWGRNQEGGPVSPVLREATVQLIQNSQCRQLADYERITHTMLCAGYISGGVDACHGDSGGPLVVDDENKRSSIIGIISWGIGCARPYKPGVYTRVSSFLPWIIQNTEDGCYCF